MNGTLAIQVKTLTNLPLKYLHKIHMATIKWQIPRYTYLRLQAPKTIMILGRWKVLSAVVETSLSEEAIGSMTQEILPDTTQTDK